VNSLVEKPEPEDAPSTWATIGRYVFTPEIFDLPGKTEPGYAGELRLTDAMAALSHDERVQAKEFQARRFGVGTVEGFLKANLLLGLSVQAARRCSASLDDEHR